MAFFCFCIWAQGDAVLELSDRGLGYEGLLSDPRLFVQFVGPASMNFCIAIAGYSAQYGENMRDLRAACCCEDETPDETPDVEMSQSEQDPLSTREQLDPRLMEPIDSQPLVSQRSDRSLRKLMADVSAAERYAECCICYSPLHEQPCAVLMLDDERACTHHLHFACAERVLAEGDSSCPLCRAAFSRLRRVPTIEESPAGWFMCVDADQSGQLSRQEVTRVLTSQFPLDEAKLDEALDRLWHRWDADGSGSISSEDFLAPDRGPRALDVRPSAPSE
eukprot:3210171-Prymnesium_polylepis.2